MEEQEFKTEGEQLSLQSLFIEVKKNLLLIIVITLLFALAGGLYSKFFVKTKYTSRGSFIVNVSMEESKVTETTAYSYAVSLTNSLAPFIKTANVGKKAAELYNSGKYNKDADGNLVPPVEQLKEGVFTGSLTVTTTEKNFIITVICTTTNPNADKILQAAMDATQEVANELTDKDGKRTVMYNKFLQYEAPSYPSSDSSTRIYKYILIFMLLGLVVSAVVIILKILFNDTYKTKEDLERDLNVEVLALIDDLAEVKEGSHYGR